MEEREATPTVEHAASILGVDVRASPEAVERAYADATARYTSADLTENPLRHLLDEKLEKLDQARRVLLRPRAHNSIAAWSDLRTGMVVESVRALLGSPVTTRSLPVDDEGICLVWLYAPDGVPDSERPQARFRQRPGRSSVLDHWLAPTSGGVVRVSLPPDSPAPVDRQNSQERSSAPLVARIASVVALSAIGWLMTSDRFVVAAKTPEAPPRMYVGTRGIDELVSDYRGHVYRTFPQFIATVEGRLSRMEENESPWGAEHKQEALAQVRDQLRWYSSLSSGGIAALILGSIGALAFLALAFLPRTRRGLQLAVVGSVGVAGAVALMSSIAASVPGGRIFGEYVPALTQGAWGVLTASVVPVLVLLLSPYAIALHRLKSDVE